MGKKSIKRNYLYNVSYQVLTLITPMVTTPYISRVLGANGIGMVSYAESIVSYFTLFAAMGVTIYGQREISYVQNSVDNRSRVFWNTKFFTFCTVLVALVFYAMFIYSQENIILYLILSLNLFSVLADVTWFFQGMEEFGKIVSRNIFFKCISIIYFFLMVKSEEDTFKYAFGIAFFALISNVSLWRYMPRYIEKIRFSEIHPFTNVKTILSLFIPTIAIQIYTVLDKTMIGIITNSSYENGYYEQALKISRMILTMVTALGTVMIPRIGYYFEKKNIEEVKRLMYRGYRFVWFLGIPLCFGLICVSFNFVPWFFGKGYDKVIDLLKILSFLILAIGINNVTGMQYLIPTKRQNLFTLAVVIGACTNIILNAILIPLIQSVGAAIASVAAETVIAVVQLILVRKEISFWQVLKEGIHYYIAGILMAVGLLILGKLLSPSIIHTGIMILCGATVYFLILLIIRDEFLLSNIKALIGRIHKGI